MDIQSSHKLLNGLRKRFNPIYLCLMNLNIGLSHFKKQLKNLSFSMAHLNYLFGSKMTKFILKIALMLAREMLYLSITFQRILSAQ
jgi:hypothetical protein